MSERRRPCVGQRRHRHAHVVQDVIAVAGGAVAAEALPAALLVVGEHRRDHVAEVAHQHHLARAGIQLQHQLGHRVGAVLLDEVASLRPPLRGGDLRIQALDALLRDACQLADRRGVEPRVERRVADRARERRLLAQPPRAVDRSRRRQLAAIARPGRRAPGRPPSSTSRRAARTRRGGTRRSPGGRPACAPRPSSRCGPASSAGAAAGAARRSCAAARACLAPAPAAAGSRPPAAPRAAARTVGSSARALSVPKNPLRSASGRPGWAAATSGRSISTGSRAEQRRRRAAPAPRRPATAPRPPSRAGRARTCRPRRPGCGASSAKPASAPAAGWAAPR